jgi:hypothetical protein
LTHTIKHYPSINNGKITTFTTHILPFFYFLIYVTNACTISGFFLIENM